jgi:hypothetical protein
MTDLGDNTPPQGTRLSGTSWLMADLAEAWAHLRQLTITADEVQGRHREAALRSLERQLAALGGIAERIRGAIREIREQEERAAAGR